MADAIFVDDFFSLHILGLNVEIPSLQPHENILDKSETMQVSMLFIPRRKLPSLRARLCMQTFCPPQSMRVLDAESIE